MNSETSSDDIDVGYLDNNKINVNIDNLPQKNESSTDVYLNLVANDNKVRDDENDNISESLNVLSSNSHSSNSNSHSSNSNSQPIFQEVDINNINKRSKRKKNSKRDSKRDSISESKKDLWSSAKSSIKQEYYDNSPDLQPKLTPQQIRMKKIELLRKLSELKSKGYKLSKEYSFESPIEEMEYEFDLLKSFADKRNGVKLYKSLIVNAASVAEFANDKYDPFNFELSGWSQHMNVEVDSYEDVLEELYEKYKGKGNKMSPELKLGLLVLFSASAFHFSKKHLSNVPGLNKVMENNPDFMANIVAPKKKTSQYMSEQEINIEKQKRELREKEKKNKKNINNIPNNMSNNIPNNMSNNIPNNNSYNVSNFMANLDETPQHSLKIETPFEVNNIIQNNPNIDNPNIDNSIKVQNILDRLHDRDDDNTDTQEESSINNNRIMSDSISISENGTKKKKKKNKKPIMKIF